MKKKVITTIIILAFIIALFYIFTSKSESPNDNPNTKILLKTTQGDITLELNNDMPITTGNFIKLVNEGFYDGIIFHRVINGFMIQGGDPTGTGTGGPGYTINDEFVLGSTNVRGTISMANTGQANSGGSQFFINLVDNTFLDWDKQPINSKHPAFGKVIKGMEVIDSIAKTSVNPNTNKPLEDIKILEAKVL